MAEVIKLWVSTELSLCHGPLRDPKVIIIKKNRGQQTYYNHCIKQTTTKPFYTVWIGSCCKNQASRRKITPNFDKLCGAQQAHPLISFDKILMLKFGWPRFLCEKP